MSHAQQSTSSFLSQYIWRILGWSLAVGILLVPMIAMQFSDEVNWTLSDFVLMGALVSLTGLLLEFATKLSDNTAYRAGFALAVLVSLLLIWMNLAVGLIGNEANPINLVFALQIAAWAIGALWFRAKAAGMVAVMLAAALVQALLTLLALFLPWNSSFALHILILGLWLLCAKCFSVAAKQGHN